MCGMTLKDCDIIHVVEKHCLINITSLGKPLLRRQRITDWFQGLLFFSVISSTSASFAAGAFAQDLISVSQHSHADFILNGFNHETRDMSRGAAQCIRLQLAGHHAYVGIRVTTICFLLLY
jgi:hypothetical protein